MLALEDKLSPTRHVMRLLLDNRIQEAQKYIDETLMRQIAELEREATALRKEQSLLSSLARFHAKSEDRELASMAIQADPPPAVPLSLVDDLLESGEPFEDARHAIFAMCTELAQQKGGVLVLGDAVEEVKRRGIDLRSSRPGTSIGNMLFKSADWTRMGEGIFRWNHYKE